MGGFECSCYQSIQGARLDMIAATEHDKHVLADYLRLSAMGITTVRDGVRWHLVERVPGHYDFSSVIPMIRAARQAGMQVIWDLCHYGWPDGLDIFKAEFISRYAGFVTAFMHVLSDETDTIPFITPINEISYFAWACGEVGYMFPHAYHKGDEVKKQLVRATIEGSEAIWQAAPEARIVNVDPAIYIVADPSRPDQVADASLRNVLQYEARDMLTGKVSPELGGADKYLDIVGVNYYPFNQWAHGITSSHADYLATGIFNEYRPFNEMLAEIYNRYHRPVFISETGSEFHHRASWLRYIMQEVNIAKEKRIPVEGVCWYPIVNNPHWDDESHCYNGLWDYADSTGHREIYRPLADEIIRNT